MEPPAVNVGVGYQRSNNSLDKNRRDLILCVDSHQMSYASTSRHTFELPENFLETISPQQSTSCSLELNQANRIHSDLGTSSCLSPGISISDQRYSNENVDILPHLSDHHQSGLDSGLLTTSSVEDLSSTTRRPIYIKEEFYLPSYDDEHEDDELLHNQSPISMQNDLVSSVLNSEEHFLPLRQPPTVKSPSPLDSKESIFQIKLEEESTISTSNFSSLVDPLNADLDSDVFIDTKALCTQIGNELKQHSIPQAVFAEKVLCRSQGTLSDLLRNPKPWPKLKSGRETFRRMFNWMSQPQHIRLAILDIKDNSDLASLINNSPPTPAKASRIRQTSVSDDGNFQSKRPRLVFSDVQKRTLQAIFKETQRPSREMQNTIAEHLGLDLSTVSNFFMNARRRSRGLGSLVDDLSNSEQSTPPSNTPTKGYRRHHHPSTSSTTSSSNINDTVDAVIAGFGLANDAGTQQGSSNYSGNRKRTSARRSENRIKQECSSPPSL